MDGFILNCPEEDYVSPREAQVGLWASPHLQAFQLNTKAMQGHPRGSTRFHRDFWAGQHACTVSISQDSLQPLGLGHARGPRQPCICSFTWPRGAPLIQEGLEESGPPCLLSASPPSTGVVQLCFCANKGATKGEKHCLRGCLDWWVTSFQ